MNKMELILSTLKKMGFNAKIDKDGDILVRYQMKSIVLMTSDDEDEPYVSMVLMCFSEVEEGSEPLVLTVCNKLTRELKLVKVYIDNSFKEVSASCEFYYANQESLEQNLQKCFNILGIIRTLYRKNKDELMD